jgi:hypothetical protein
MTWEPTRTGSPETGRESHDRAASDLGPHRAPQSRLATSLPESSKIASTGFPEALRGILEAESARHGEGRPVKVRRDRKPARQERLEAGGITDMWQTKIRAGSAELLQRINLLKERMNP